MPEEIKLNITYIDHSGFIVEDEFAAFLFDYYKGEIPNISEKKPLYVFASHMHNDHFNFEIFNIVKKHKNTKFILSRDIRKKFNKNFMVGKMKVPENIYDEIVFMLGNTEFEDSNIKVRTVMSTDAGVAFVVTQLYSGKNIFHAGDLNWWVWDGMTEVEKEHMERRFTNIIDKLIEFPIEVAFFPLDPKLGDRYALGFDYFMNHIKVEHIVPMHLWGQYDTIRQLINSPVSERYRDKIIIYDECNRLILV